MLGTCDVSPPPAHTSSQFQLFHTYMLKWCSLQIYITCCFPERVVWQQSVVSMFDMCIKAYTHSLYACRALLHGITYTSPVDLSSSLTFETKSNFPVKCNKSSLAPGYVWLLGDLRITLIRLHCWSTASRQCRLFWWMMWNKIERWQKEWPWKTKHQSRRLFF